VEKKYKVSPSQLNQFYQCPLKWKLLHLDRVRITEVKNPKKDLGRNIHEIIASYYKNIGNNPTPKQIEYVANACFNTEFEPYLTDYKTQAQEMLKNFINFEKSRLNNYVKPILIEKELEDEDFRGVIDALFLYPQLKLAHILDWKGGALMNLTDVERRQGKIYERLGYSNNVIPPNFTTKISFVVLRNGQVLDLPFTTNTWLDEQKRRMCFIIKTGRFPKIRSPLCNWCECQLACEFEGVKLWNDIKQIAI